MTSWQEIDLVNLSTDAERVPEGQYVFSLLNGAKYNQFDNQQVEYGAKITEGDYKGRVIYSSFPNPGKVDASPQAFKKFERCLVKNGAPEIQDGQDPVNYLNSEGVPGRNFVAAVQHRDYVSKDGENKQRTQIGLFSFKAIPVEG